MQSLLLENELNQVYQKIADNSNGTVLESPFGGPLVIPVDPVVTPVAPVTVPKVEAPVVVAPVVAPVPAVNQVDDQWDTDAPVETPVAPVVPQGIDFSELAKALGADNINTKEDLVKAVVQYKADAENAKTIPADLAKASEIARLGGNYLEYLGVSTVDWAKEDPIEMYENYVTEQLRDPVTGAYDFEKIDEYLDGQTETTKVIEGRKLQNQYIGIQRQQLANLENQARQQRVNFEQSVRSTLDKMDTIGNYKVTAAHKAELYNDIVSGKDLESQDIQKRALNAFKAKYFDKIEAFLRSKAKNDTLKSILDEVQVPQLSSSTTTVDSTPARGYSIEDYIAEIEKKRAPIQTEYLKR